MPFVDELRIDVVAGDGGAGRVSFRREKFVPRGGPDGGDGGDGGAVILLADSKLMSLESLASRRIYRAENGASGGGNKKHGKNGADLVLEVPAGTLIKDAERGHVLKDLDRSGAQVVIAQGGKGGRGNTRFATSTDRTPRKAEPGTPGERRELRLELKLIADVGLVGYPNAGKSTLLNALSSAQPRIAPYPFTTLTPNLGIIDHDYEAYVVADVPGLIEGASEGKGLGHQFLRHVERTRVLLHLIDASDPRPVGEAYQAVRDEMDAFGGELLSKPETVVLTKMDLVEDRDDVVRQAREHGLEPQLVSSVTREGVQELIEDLATKVEAARSA